MAVGHGNTGERISAMSQQTMCPLAMERCPRNDKAARFDPGGLTREEGDEPCLGTGHNS